MSELKPHPLSLLPPPLTTEQNESLGESILKNGKIDDIVIYEGMILNGNHGYRHCIKHGIPFQTREFIPNGVATAEDFVIAKLEGRHLNIGQKACISALISKRTKKDPLQNLKFVGKSEKPKSEGRTEGRTSYKVGKSMGVGINSVMKAMALLNGNKSLFNKVYLGEVSINSAYNEHRRNSGSSHKYNKITSVNLSAFKTDIKIPNCTCYESELSTFIKTMNAHGWILEMRFQEGKVFAHWFGNGYVSVGTSWASVHSELEYKRAVIVAANDKKEKL